jgi:glucokinase
VTERPEAGELVCALDIGGTKIAGALVDGGGAVVTGTRRPTPAAEPGESVAAALDQVVDELAASPDWSRVRAVGIGSAGPVDAVKGLVHPVNIPGWRGFPLVERVSGHPAVDGVPVVLAGDGVAMAAAEHWRGAARGHANALCMVVSTGVGGGLVLGGSVYAGPSGNAGHIGHTSVDLDGDPCACGGRGCLETIASGTAIARHALRGGWQPADGDASAAAVGRAALAGDPVALAAYDRAARALAAGIAATAALIEIEVAVIGGGVAQSGDLIFAPLRRWLTSYATLPFTRTLAVKPAVLGTDAGVVGAAAIALQALGLPLNPPA